jgi:hypothetical protein
VFLADSVYLKPCIGQQWIAAGEAAVSFDPLSSLGIGHALSSGIQAGRIVNERFLERVFFSESYQSDCELNFNNYLIQRQSLYMIEQRWPNSPFWSRRQKT